MRYIDAFNHFNPKRYFDALLESPAGQKDIGKRVRGIPALYDLDLRLKVVDQFPDYTQVLSLGCRWSTGCGGRTRRRRWRSSPTTGSPRLWRSIPTVSSAIPPWCR